MNTFLIWIVTALYAGQAVVLASGRDWPNMLIFSGYALANLGLIWGMK